MIYAMYSILLRMKNVFIIWPVRPRARFHFKAFEKIPVRGPYAMAGAGPEKSLRLFARCELKQLCCLRNPDFSVKMSDVLKWTFHCPKKKKEKCGGHMIKCCARSVDHDLGPNIFLSGPPTQSLSTYFSLVHKQKYHFITCIQRVGGFLCKVHDNL